MDNGRSKINGCWEACAGLRWPGSKQHIPPHLPTGDFTQARAQPASRCCLAHRWLSTSKCPGWKALRPHLFHLCPAFYRGRNQGKGSSCVPFRGRLLFLRAVLLDWRSLKVCTILDFTGPEREVKWVRSVPRAHLGTGSNSACAWKNIQPKVEPKSQPQGTNAERFLSLDQCLFPQEMRK